MAKMPRGLPTPANSTDIQGKDGTGQFPGQAMQMSFELPPPAITTDSRPASASAKSSSASSYHPTSPKSPAYQSTASAGPKRRQSSMQGGIGKDGGMPGQFALPPPPMRSRKIIQMKPRQQVELDVPIEVPLATGTTAVVVKGTPEKGKKKQPSSTSAAGRKIARKTAHSLIERRRRSKMNEEFGVLKDMIPACSGEMHKLAILQASIEYIRYLEDCVSQLKAQNEDQIQPNKRTPTPNTNTSRPSSTRPVFSFDNFNAASYGNSAVANQDDEEEDVDMDEGIEEEEEASSPTLTTYSSHKPTAPSTQPKSYSQSTQPHHPSISPTVQPQSSHPTTIPQPQQYSTTTSTTTSPNFNPQKSPFIYPSPQNTAYIRSTSISSSHYSQLTSPALIPIKDVERESAAMAALMMLNCDRRGVGDRRGNLSVKDLLSA